MGTDDYSSAIGGGLKLKGSKPAGVTKKKKKKKDKSKENSNRQPDAEDPRAVALQKALADEDRAANEEAGEEAEEEDYEPGSNKTETERKYEEMKRKRVCLHLVSFLPAHPTKYRALPVSTAPLLHAQIASPLHISHARKKIPTGLTRKRSSTSA